MDDELDWLSKVEQNEAKRARDPQTDLAKAALLERIQAADRVFYVQQLEVLHEATFFHWITGRALRELIDEGRVQAFWEELFPNVRIRLVTRKSYRHWKREGQRVLDLVRRFSSGDFGRAIGPYGEMLVDGALGGMGVRLLGRDVRQLDGRAWTRTEHNLDRAYELDAVRYGVEINNTLKYVDDSELAIKLQMCDELGLRPLFIVRMMPKSWAWPRIIKAGGYVMMLGEQFYPVGSEAFAAEVRQRLLLPVSCPAQISGRSHRQIPPLARRESRPQPTRVRRVQTVVVRCGSGGQFTSGSP